VCFKEHFTQITHTFKMPNGKRANKSRRSKGRRGALQQKRDGDVPMVRKVDLFTSSIGLSLPPKNYKFVQTDSYHLANPIVGSSAGNVTGGYSFNLNNLNQVASFQALFDQYRILAVDFTIRPRCNAFVATGTSSPPPLYLVIDYDNATALASAAAATEFSTCAIVEVYQSARRVFRPRLAVATYQSGGFTGYSNQTSWIDTAYPAVEHYGIKWFLPACTASFTPEWDVDVKLHLEFRNVI